jgi:hypothetical protein
MVRAVKPVEVRVWRAVFPTHGSQHFQANTLPEKIEKNVAQNNHDRL